MRIDLVNFCDHLPYPGGSFLSIIRWQVGHIADELLVTGVPEDDPDDGPESMLHNIVKDEGVFASGPPIFISLSKSLKPLPPLGLSVRVLRASPQVNSSDMDKSNSIDQEAGPAPRVSFYAPGRTIWKFTQDSLRLPERHWIEFDRITGLPADEIDM
jgi:hypothetical protein